MTDEVILGRRIVAIVVLIALVVIWFTAPPRKPYKPTSYEDSIKSMVDEAMEQTKHVPTNWYARENGRPRN